MKKNADSDIGYPSGIVKKMFLVMKLFTCFLLLSMSLAYGNTYSQVKLSLSVRNSELEKVLEEITEKTGYHFVYSSDLLRQAGKVSVSVKEKDIRDVLTACLKGTNLGFRIEDNFIIVSPHLAPSREPQKQTVFTGSVKDKEGLPLPGVTVVLKGTNSGVVTNPDGSFQLSVPEQTNPILIFSFVGMKTVEITADGSKPINIILEEDISEVEEVVVTGYYSISKERSAGSFSRIKGDQISMKSATGIIERLNGLVPGLVVNPIGEDKFLLRGVTSINSSREPLFVVDGMPMELNVLEESVNPDDIENINVLKDATAASIWGARAANGVIVISTKRGKTKEKLRVSYSGSVQLQGLPDLDYLDYMNASDYVDFAVETFNPEFNYANVLNSYGKISPIERILYKQKTGEYTESQAKAELDKLRNSDNKQQIKDYLYRIKTVHQHNLNISGGGENTAYFFSLNYRNITPQQKGITEERVIADLKNDFQITNRIRLSAGINVAFANSKSGYVPNVVGMIPYEQLVDENGKATSQLHTFYSEESSDWTREKLDERNMAHYDFKLLDELDKQKNKSKSINTRLQAGLKIDLFRGMRFESQFQYRKGHGETTQLNKADSYWILNMRAEQTPITTGSTSRIPLGASLNKTTSFSTEWIVRNQLSYDGIFKDKHQITLLAGTEVRKNKNERNNRIVYGYNESNKKFASLDENAMSAGIAGGSLTNPSSTASQRQVFSNFGTGILETDDRFFSLYANMAYDYESRYGLNASVRMDQANLFGTGVRYKPIWSVGLLWNIHRETFFNMPSVERLSLRFSKGIAGNTPNSSVGGPQDIISYGFMPNYYFAQTKPWVYISSPALKNLKWEKTDITNFGVDFSVLKGRLSGNLDLYFKNTTDLIGKQTIDPTNGFSTISTNIGKMKNKGFELTLSSINVRKNDFTWSTGLNLSYNKNKVTDIYVEPQISGYVSAVTPVFIQDYPAYSLFSFRWAGLNEQGEPMVLNENGEATDKQMTNIHALVHSGTTQPPYSGSLSNTFSYKNLSLFVMVIYNFGHKLRNDVPGANSNSRVLYSQVSSEMSTAPWLNPLHNDLKNAWKKPGDEANTDIPRWLPQGATRINSLYYAAADMNVLNASYAYISEITLSYKLPETINRQLGIRGCLIGIQVANPFCWTANNEGVDPRFMKNMTGYKRSLKYGADYLLKLNIDF